MITLLALLQIAPAALSVRVTPDTVLAERVARPGGARALNFEFQVTNGGKVPMRLAAVRVSVRDARGVPLLERFCDESGFSPCIATIPDRTVAAAATGVVYNPFHTLPGDISVAALRYELVYADTASARRDTLRVTVAPREYVTRTGLVLPLRGRILVFDGHDFYAHHRRWPLAHPVLRQLGFRGNAGRYAYDLSIVDTAGRMYRGDGSRNEDWYSWGTPVVAAGAGVVVAAAGDEPDWDVGRTSLPDSVIMSRAVALLGNHVVIDHGNGEFSLVAHLRHASVRVRPGDRVVQGQVIGQVGFSGSVYTIHTHYQLQREADFRGEGLPSVFGRVTRIGAPPSRGPAHIDSGDIIVSH